MQNEKKNNIPFTRAQQNNANFITYTNTNLGFTIEHPSDWTVNDRNNNTVNGLSNSKSDARREKD